MELSRYCIPYTPFTGELASSKVLLASTAGVHLKSDSPFDPEGDITYRVVPGEVDTAELMITHTHYDHADADRDPNCVFPLDRLRELAQAEVIGGLTDQHFTMGFALAFRQMREQTFPQLVREIERNRPHLVVLTGGCPLCHRTIVSLQREIECVGIATVLITVDVEQSAMARPSRALHPQGFRLGHSLGLPDHPEMQSQVLQDALKLLLDPPEPGQIPSYEYPAYPVEEPRLVMTEVG